MYLKALYKSRTVDKYEGYDTIYNNEPRVKLPELIEHMERFTEVYKKNADAHPAIREAYCFDAQYPTMMLGIAANDLFVGRADIFPLGFNAQYINGEWGFVMNVPWFEARMEDPEVTDEQKARLAAIFQFWKDKTSMQKHSSVWCGICATRESASSLSRIVWKKSMKSAIVSRFCVTARWSLRSICMNVRSKLMRSLNICGWR